MQHIYQNRRHEAEPDDFFLRPKSNTPIKEIPPMNEPVNVECSITINLMTSSTEAELGGFFIKMSEINFYEDGPS